MDNIRLTLVVVMLLSCLYQGVYAFLRLANVRRRYQEGKRCRYAVLIAARNEQAVIGQLLDSIRAQEYPRELIDIFVAADNCTDSTALVAAAHGATVFERFDRSRVGKGYALAFLIHKIWEGCPAGTYDGYFVFDADNLLDPRYVAEMDRVFSAGARVVTGCRNAKNFTDNWLTAGYGLYILRESEFMNRPRDFLGTGCMVSGTGFLMAESLLREAGGWQWFSLSEDTEFSADMAIRGEHIAYCPGAMLYDEQPADLKVSVTQRSRWIKGYLQVLMRHGPALFSAWLRTGRFACYELLIGGIPAMVCGGIGFLLEPTPVAALTGLVSAYLAVYLTGLLTLIIQWKTIRGPARKKILYSFAYPVFMLTFLPALVPAVFGKAQWKCVPHTAALSIQDLTGKT